MIHVNEEDFIADLEESEIDIIAGGPVPWVAIAAIGAYASAALYAYEVGKRDGQCHV